MRLVAEGGGAFETDQAEDRDDDAQAEARQGQMRGIELSRIDGETVLRQHDEAKQADQRHRDALEDQHHHGRELDVLPGAIPGNRDADGEEQNRRDMDADHRQQLAGEDGEAGDARRWKCPR